jgi:hypothetical protein
LHQVGAAAQAADGFGDRQHGAAKHGYAIVGRCQQARQDQRGRQIDGHDDVAAQAGPQKGAPYVGHAGVMGWLVHK